MNAIIPVCPESGLDGGFRVFLCHELDNGLSDSSERKLAKSENPALRDKHRVNECRREDT